MTNNTKQPFRNIYLSAAVLLLFLGGCKKNTPAPSPVPPGGGGGTTISFKITRQTINSQAFTSSGIYRGITATPVILVSFSDKIDKGSVANAVAYSNKSQGPAAVSYNVSYQDGDSTMLLTPATSLSYLNEYLFSVSTLLKSASGAYLSNRIDLDFVTELDPSSKFPLISEDSLLTLVQKQTFKYFWDFGHPVSGLARERNTSGDIVTTGGSGFGIMAIPVAVNRGFITRAEGLARVQKIVGFLKNTAVTVKGAFPHWMNGSTGQIVPFSTNDNGADLVETSYLMMGLLTARQYFDDAGTDETALRNDITALYDKVEWDWFRNGGQNVLYWHYSPDKGWIMNMPIRGWNECLITYILAASSPTHGIPASVYSGGWAANGTNGFLNGSSYYGLPLPLGPSYGGPLFFEQYTFLGVNPTGLSDAYANYETQTKNHSLINYNYCKTNPKSWYGYSDSCWGLTASDIPGGYTASSPTNDVGVIAPTAALSSFPYTPVESMKALKYFYYTLGDKIWKDYGFVDAFKLQDLWFAGSYLAIDQGPVIGMIENYRTRLLWNLFTSCPEVKNGMKNVLGFSAPYL